MLLCELVEDESNEEEDTDTSTNDHMELSDEERDEVYSLNGPEYTFKDEETKSRFTEYSMSSSVMRRNEQLALLDEKFEKVCIFYKYYQCVNTTLVIIIFFCF